MRSSGLLKGLLLFVLCAFVFCEDHEGEEHEVAHEVVEEVKEVIERLENEIGEEVRETREEDIAADSPFDRTVAVKFVLAGEQNEDGEFFEKINQIEALYWQDPAWDTYTPAWAEEGSKTTVSVIADPDITSLHAGRPATYKMRYDVTYRKNPHLPGTEGFVVNGGQLVEAGGPARDVARRTVEVTPIDWAKCMNEPFDENDRDCRFVQYLNKEPCRSFSPEYLEECLVFYEWSGIIPDDAGPVLPISRTTSSVVNEVNENGDRNGMFYIKCNEQEAAPKADRRLFGLFHFPKDGDTYSPICSPCQRRGICPPYSVCQDLGSGEYECLCIAGYDMDKHGNCVRNHTNPEIQLRFKNRHQSVTKLKQCGRYIEEGYDVVVGNNPGDSPGEHYVDVDYPPELAAESVRYHGEFEVSYWLKGTTVQHNPPPVKRPVIVEQVDRCGFRHCGEQCPENTLCQHQPDEPYPRDIACVCYQPRQCSNPDDMNEEHLPAFYEDRAVAAREYHIQKLAEGYKWHLPPTRCYEEEGERSQTTCEDAAPPVLYYKEYQDPVYSCKVCNSPITEGSFQEPDCWFFDFHDGREEKCQFSSTKHLQRINETFSVEDVKLIARDTKGHETYATIKLYHQIQDISKEIEELIHFRKQMRDFEAAIEGLLYWCMVIGLTFAAILLIWLAFTAEGMLFFRTLCRKVTNPSVSWAHHEANIIAEDIFNKRNPNSPARRT
uniref:EGF-like domain-containing protein n=1 Tax=Paramoeba aestuarina TaxID=180227 RepID=A0A7S4KWU8_9EUKA|mmetsp:Transcript_26605/g.41431  ORF Transcript_26605/g.41431 Transcript_26605/m.41431 type:complete len:720 (+) Transcript_26605:32-2191(+)|eukprot:CAMPEP_0201527758 /NCGR_PEP_ID=MMETSP0161_2-20130828/36225_1 /ASSEMBLY_ACC=CAM_ASM_000251 /TAXON_ID=180227 /ORGANISM="Neoparamoeba aestuarina, Strain SoJaBio B1-5/56/2" /LENGTH=719 /DNA_ID=CAMNT_0047928715 /DNA_START=12 /DNA_END=2171 /DNA_ORIENTATION=+